MPVNHLVKRIGFYSVYLLFRLGVGLMSLIPFRGMYALSDGLALLLDKVLRYRQQVIKDNLSKCFPSLTPQETSLLYSQFIRHLSDLFLEGIKGFTMSRDELMARYKVNNPEILDPFAQNQQSILFAGSHYNNWEWGVLIFPQWLPMQVSGIYQTVTNPYIHEFLMNRRSVFGMNLIGLDNAIQHVIDHTNHHATMILSDQSPSNMKRAIWTTFLGRNTPCLHGLGVMAKKSNFPIVYYEVTKIKRGWYEVDLKALFTDPSQFTVEEMVIAYTQEVEKTILKAPQYWLWSHRRWKRAG